MSPHLSPCNFHLLLPFLSSPKLPHWLLPHANLLLAWPLEARNVPPCANPEVYRSCWIQTFSPWSPLCHDPLLSFSAFWEPLFSAALTWAEGHTLSAEQELWPDSSVWDRSACLSMKKKKKKKESKKVIKVFEIFIVTFQYKDLIFAKIPTFACIPMPLQSLFCIECEITRILLYT